MPPAEVLADERLLNDPARLTAALVDIESVSGNEAEITDAVAAVLDGCQHLSVRRFGNTLVARTDLGLPQRVVLAGHLDTVPVAGNLPSRAEGGLLHGCGTVDMKSGVALQLHLAATMPAPRFDLTYLFYDCEEIDSAYNGLSKLSASDPELLTDADFAVLLEPTHGLIEAGCQGTLRVLARIAGRRAHSARSWLGSNAVHAAGPLLTRLADHQARSVTIDGCTYREGLNAVRIGGGVAGNVIPDECTVEVNFRFAPDRSVAEATDHVREVLAGVDLEVVDAAPGAMPGLTDPAARELIAAVGVPPRAKLGWTDVSRFSALGVPALNYGPGDPNLAHAVDERVEIAKIEEGAAVLRRWLTPAPAGQGG